MVCYFKLICEVFVFFKYVVIIIFEGKEVLLGDVVELIEKLGISYICCEGGYWIVYIYGSIDEEVIELGEVVK